MDFFLNWIISLGSRSCISSVHVKHEQLINKNQLGKYTAMHTKHHLMQKQRGIRIIKEPRQKPPVKIKGQKSIHIISAQPSTRAQFAPSC
jgi:hypothetical protein